MATSAQGIPETEQITPAELASLTVAVTDAIFATGNYEVTLTGHPEGSDTGNFEFVTATIYKLAQGE